MALVRVRSDGRGTDYRPWRGLLESTFRTLYARDWPARLWARLPGSCDVECSEVQLKVLPPGSAHLRVGFISDIHIGPTTPQRLLENAFARLAAARLDVLLLGGDYVYLDANEEKAALLASLVERVPARRKFAVMGNHDLWTHHALLEAALLRAGVELLCNESRALDGQVALIGLDDPWVGHIDARAALQGAGQPAMMIVLCHSPDGLPAATEAILRRPHPPPTLFVCGHTHAGQISTPWGPVVVPGRLGKQFPQGMHTVGPIQLYVSRGVGGVELPVRAYARPEVVVFELVP